VVNFSQFSPFDAWTITLASVWFKHDTINFESFLAFWHNKLISIHQNTASPISLSPGKVVLEAEP
jgi:hypothetical protein